MTSLEEDNPAKSLPEINEYLSLCFQLSGMYGGNGMGCVPLSWAEIKAFSEQAAYPLTGWESEQLILMSRSYCSMAHKGTELGCPAPYQEGISDEEVEQSMRDKVTKQWEAFGSKLQLRKKKGA